MSVKTWGDFEIDFGQLLGRGGMGSVYRGRQVSVDRPAAVKILKQELTTSSEFVKRFHREAALLARLTDPHVVQVFGAGEGEGCHFYAMEYVEGEDLGSRLKRGSKFSIEEIIQVALQVGKALQAAWRHRIVHRDIKPSNILVTRDGQIKVMDFGLAKNPDMELTQSEVIMGTAKYMSPEQAQGEPVDVRSDLYSLGAVLYELATGRPPFTGESPTAVMYQHVHRAPRPPSELNPQIPPRLEALILKLLAKKPEDRPATPEAFVAE
ncbi:MAG: serine/threonine-protein kinase, partial [Planctomycetota bacterium]